MKPSKLLFDIFIPFVFLSILFASVSIKTMEDDYDKRLLKERKKRGRSTAKINQLAGSNLTISARKGLDVDNLKHHLFERKISEELICLIVRRLSVLGGKEARTLCLFSDVFWRENKIHSSITGSKIDQLNSPVFRASDGSDTSIRIILSQHEGLSSHAGVFFSIGEKERDCSQSSPYNCRTDIKILNQYSDDHIEKSFDPILTNTSYQKLDSDNVQYVGNSTFASNIDLIKEGFIENNNLLVEVTTTNKPVILDYDRKNVDVFCSMKEGVPKYRESVYSIEETTPKYELSHYTRLETIEEVYSVKETCLKEVTTVNKPVAPDSDNYKRKLTIFGAVKNILPKFKESSYSIANSTVKNSMKETTSKCGLSSYTRKDH